MANSSHKDTSLILDFLLGISARTILDVGAGFGRWGFLCRCHLSDGVSLEVEPEQPLVVDAIEAFKPNINAVYRAVYNKVYEGDVTTLIDQVGRYDVIICSHMIEHLDKQTAWKLIAAMKARCIHALVLGLPLNDDLRDGVAGNDYEAHKSVWTEADFSNEPVTFRRFPFLPGLDTAVVIYSMSPTAQWAARHVTSPVARLRHKLGRMANRLRRAARRLSMSSLGGRR